jgi:hypothetical protein
MEEKSETRVERQRPGKNDLMGDADDNESWRHHVKVKISHLLIFCAWPALESLESIYLWTLNVAVGQQNQSAGVNAASVASMRR